MRCGIIRTLVIGVWLWGCQQSPAERPPLQDVSLEKFARLGVLHGRWIGGWGSAGRQVEPLFLEEYRLVDDSTITILESPDTLAAHLRVVGNIMLRQGTVRYQRGDDEWAAVIIGTRGGTFLPADGIVGGFTYGTGNGPLVITWHGRPFRGYAMNDSARVLEPVANHR